MRVKNEARFLEPCIMSCIDALDELIVVYVDCTDETEKILKELKNKYPNKLRIFEYNYNVLWFDLTEDEYNYAMNLSEDSPRLYSSVCNYALSKVEYKYAVKIDADQNYFFEEVQRWRNVCATKSREWHYKYIIGWLFMLYFSVYRRISLLLKKPCLGLLPNWLVSVCYNYYRMFAEWQLIRGKVVVAWSGLNLFKDKDWFVPFDGKNIHPPYNGEGDTVIFKVSDKTFYLRHKLNRTANRSSYSVTEDFYQPISRIMFTEPVWFHQHANRVHCWSKVKKQKDEHPELFIPICEFINMEYSEVHKLMDKNAHSNSQRTLFALIHKIGRNVIKSNMHILDNLKL